MVEVKIGGTALPGDTVDLVELDKTRVGRGLAFNRVTKEVFSTTAGIVSYNGVSQALGIRSSSTRYTPRVNDVVIGVVSQRTSEFYKLDIKALDTAIIGKLATNKATKQNPLQLENGDVVFARVTHTDSDLEPLVTMKDGTSRADSAFSVLSGGYLIDIPDRAVQFLLSTDPVEMEQARAVRDAMVGHELTVGHNGRAYIRAKDAADTVKVARAYLAVGQRVGDISDPAVLAECVKG